MLRQHIYQWREGGYQTVALSGACPDVEWLMALEERTEACAADPCDEPLFYQFTFADCLVVGRRIPLKGKDGYSFRQLIVSGNELDDFRRARPLPLERLSMLGEEAAGGVIPLGDLSASSVADDDALMSCFEALTEVFHQNEELLASLVAALRQTANGLCRCVCVRLPFDDVQTSLHAQRIMELMLRALDTRTASTLRWRSLQPQPNPLWPVAFASAESPALTPIQQRCTALIVPDEQTVSNLPRPVEELDREAARALIARDLNWLDRLFAVPQPLPPVSERLRIRIPAFEEGMSLKQYFEDWAEELEERRKMLDADAFELFAHSEWERLSGQFIVAGEVMESKEYIFDMYHIIDRLRRREYAALLCMPAQSLIDMVSLLLDSLDWDEMSLGDENDRMLLRHLAVFAHSLDDATCAQVRTGKALRILYALFEHEPQMLIFSLNTIEELSRTDATQFEQLQNLFRSHVLAQCADSSFHPNDSFVVYAMLGYVRFVEGVPDLRPLLSLEKVIRVHCGNKAAQRFQSLLDYQRRQMSPHTASHSSRAWLIALYVVLGVIALAAAFALFHTSPGF